MAKKTVSRRDFVKATALGGGALVLAACATPAAPAAPAATAAPVIIKETVQVEVQVTAAPVIKPGGTLVLGYPQKTTFGNFCQPYKYAGTQDLYQRRLIYSGLIQWNNDFSAFLPDLAESYKFDGNSCTFALNKAATWHDGTPFTADDVIFTFNVICHKDSLYTNPEALVLMVVGAKEYKEQTATEIKGIRKIDDHTVVFDLTAAYRDPFLNAIAVEVMDPKHLLSEKPLSELLPEEGICKTKWALETGIGTGPFKVEKYVPDQFIELARNDNYHRGKIQLEKIIYTAYTDAQAQAAALESGECHVGTIPTSEYPRFKDMTHIDILLNEGQANHAFFFNINMVEQKIRQAMWWALDRQAMVDSYYNGATSVPRAIFEYGDFGVGPNVPQYTYDPERAKALLKEAKWDGSRTLRFMVEEISPKWEVMFSMAMAYWKDVGIEFEFQVVGTDYGNLQNVPDGTDMLFSGQVWGAVPSEGANYYLNSPDDWPFIDIAESREIVEKINLSTDPEEIKQAVYRLQEIGSEQASVIPIGRVPGIWIINKRVKGGLNPIYALWTRNDWEWEKITVEDA